MSLYDSAMNGWCRHLDWAFWRWPDACVLLLVGILHSATTGINFSVPSGWDAFFSRGQVGLAWWNEAKLNHHRPLGFWRKRLHWTIWWLPVVQLGPDFKEVSVPLWPLEVVGGALAWRAWRRRRA
jgi:hypothetical protein